MEKRQTRMIIREFGKWLRKVSRGFVFDPDTDELVFRVRFSGPEGEYNRLRRKRKKALR
jgi:hypothetical protein